MDNYEAAGEQRSPRYEGEDVSPTSKRELMGWYTYGLAAEVFAVCGVGSFLPITLEQLARERGVLVSDQSQPCVRVAEAAARLMMRDDGPGDDGQCVVHLLGVQVNTASFAMYTFSFAVLVQALVVVSFSSMADHGKNRKTLLMAFGLTGSIVTMLMILIFPSIYFVACFLVVVGVTCMGSSFVILNSFLPLLVANHPEVIASGGASSSINLESLPRHDSFSASEEDDPSLSVSHLKNSQSTSRSTEIRVSAQISSKGVGIGYAAAVFVQILSIGLLLLTKEPLSAYSQTLPMRIILFVVGAWWFTFTIVSGSWLRDRPGPPLEKDSSRSSRGWRSYLTYIKFAWSSLWKTIKVAIKLRQVVTFLIAWFLLSDAVATVSGTAILFAKTELHMATTSLALLSMLVMVSGIGGAYLWPIISKRLGMSSNHTIMACIALLEIIPIYGLLGYLPFIQRWGVGGLQQPWEIYPLGFIHGFVMGGISSYCRSFFGLLIPPGSEAAFYALYAVTDKGSSVFGPAIAGKIVDVTGHIRPVFGFLAILLLLPAPLMWMIDAGKGRTDALAMAEHLNKLKSSGHEPNSVRDQDEEAEGLLEDSDS